MKKLIVGVLVSLIGCSCAHVSPKTVAFTPPTTPTKLPDFQFPPGAQEPNPFLQLLMGMQEKPVDLDADPIMIEDEINGDLADNVIKQIKHQELTKKTIRISINSVGGSIYDGRRIVNALLNSPAISVCTVSDWALSDAAIILEEGCDQRVAYKSSILMLHQVSSRSEGQLTQIENGEESLKAINLSIEQAIASRSNLSVEDIEKHTSSSREWWINSDDLLKYGLVDRVVKGKPDKLQPKPSKR